MYPGSLYYRLRCVYAYAVGSQLVFLSFQGPLLPNAFSENFAWVRAHDRRMLGELEAV